MRTMLLFCLLVPFISRSQLNRSATELAQENIREYVVSKLFRDQAYEPVFYGQLKAHRIKNRKEIAWKLEHRFDISETRADDKKTGTARQYRFIFFLDDKMTVILAEGFYQQ
jgi:hypothetical protein